LQFHNTVTFVTQRSQQNARLKYLPRAKQQTISAQFFFLAVAIFQRTIPLDKQKYLKKALYAATFIALPESAFLPSIIRTLEASPRAAELLMRTYFA
jgi:hypothetical protein